MSDDQIEPQYDYNYDYDDANNNNDEDDPQPMLQDLYYQASDHLKKGKNIQAIQGFKNLLSESQNHNSNTWVLKSMNSIIQIQCRLNMPQCKESLIRLIKTVDNYSKKQSEDTIKQAVENITQLKDKNIYFECKKIIEQMIRQKPDQLLKMKTFIKLADISLHDQQYTTFEKLLSQLKKIEQTIPIDKKTELKLEIYCLEIQYIQKIGGGIQKIKQIAKAAQHLKTQLNDSRIMGIIKQNVGKMLVYEGEYQKASIQLMDAFKEYITIGNQNAKLMLKYAAFIGILSKLEINPFFNIETKVYQQDEQILAVQNLRTSFQKRDIKSFYKHIQNEHIKNDQFLAPLINELKQIMNIQKLKIIMQSYERIKFDYLSKILKTNVKNVQKYIYTLIVEGKLNGKINAIDGYFQKNKDYDKFLDQQQKIINQFLTSISRQ